MRLLAERIHVHRPVGGIEGAVQLARRFAVCGQLAQRLEVEALHARLLGEDPLLVITGQERAAVKRHRRREQPAAFSGVGRAGGGAQGGLQFGHVRLYRSSPEPHRKAFRRQHRPIRGSGRFQLLPKGRKRDTQFMARDLQLLARPEDLKQLFPKMFPLEMIRQVGEQCGGLLSAEPGDGAVRLPRAQPAQQLDPPPPACL
jgi:hypothetical protein